MIASEFFRNLLEKHEKIKSINRNEFVKFRFMFIENFDVAYRAMFLSSKHKPENKSFPTFLFLQYSMIFDDREDKIEFCKKFITRLEADKEDLMVDYAETKEDLLTLFKIEWDSIRKAMKGEKTVGDLHSRVSDTEKKLDSILDLQSQIDLLIADYRSNKRKGRKKSKAIKYLDLFTKEGYGQKVKDVLSDNGYLNQEGMWRGETRKKNELAVLFYLLKLPKYRYMIIRNVDNKNSIIAFYKEFGLKVDVQGETGGYCLYTNISQDPGAAEIREKFKEIFNRDSLRLDI